MKAQMIDVNISDTVKHLFDEQINLTEIIEYGIQWEDLINGKVDIPRNGARFDISFEGTVNGPEITGTIKGTDYLEIRSDGKFILNIHARIITDDGETIAVKEDGISAPGDSGVAHLNLNFHFYTASEKYQWLNTKQVWAVGEVDMVLGKVQVKGYLN
jgi:hypothetical protein